MERKMEELFSRARGLVRIGLVHVFSANVLNKVVAFASNVLIVRILTKTDFGLFSAANNIVSLAMLITGAGTLSGTLQYGAEDRPEPEKAAYFRYCALVGVGFNLVLMLGVYLYALSEAVAFDQTRGYIVLLIPTILLHYLYEYCGVILRSRREAKRYAVLLNVNSVCYSVLSCVGAFLGGIPGLILGRCAAYGIGCTQGLVFIRGDIGAILRGRRLVRLQKNEVLRFSVSCCLISALNRMLYILDVTIISYTLNNADLVAAYRAGTQIPEALEFIPTSILVTVIPYFALHNRDTAWLREWTKKLYLYSALLNVAITAAMLAISRPLVLGLWGAQYGDSLPVFRILSVNYFILPADRHQHPVGAAPGTLQRHHQLCDRRRRYRAEPAFCALVGHRRCCLGNAAGRYFCFGLLAALCI